MYVHKIIYIYIIQDLQQVYTHVLMRCTSLLTSSIALTYIRTHKATTSILYIIIYYFILYHIINYIIYIYMDMYEDDVDYP